MVTKLASIKPRVEPTKEVDLAALELLLIERAISATGPRTLLTGEPVKDADLEGLALKIGRAIVDTFSDKSIKQPSAQMVFTERECWLLRESIDIFARVGGNDLGEGLNLKRKLYQALLDFEYDRVVEDSPVSQLPVRQDSPDPPKEETMKRFEDSEGR